MSDTTMTTPKGEMAKFTYPTLKVFTGKMQFRTNGSEKVHVEKVGDVLRGAVIAVKSERMANSLATGGNFAHVHQDTPLGIPAELRPAPRVAPADTGTGTPTKAPGVATASNPVTITSDAIPAEKK